MIEVGLTVSPPRVRADARGRRRGREEAARRAAGRGLGASLVRTRCSPRPPATIVSTIASPRWPRPISSAGPPRRDKPSPACRRSTADLAPADRISYGMLQLQLRDDLAAHSSASGGSPDARQRIPHRFAPPRQVPLATVRDYESYLARLRASRYVAQQIAKMREGLRTGSRCRAWSSRATTSPPEPRRRRPREERLLRALRAFPPACPRLSASACAPPAGRPSEPSCRHTARSWTSSCASTCPARARRRRPPTCPRAGPTTRSWSATTRPSTSRPRRSTRSGSPRWRASTPRWRM